MWLCDPFPPDLQKIITPKPLELGSWYLATMFTTPYVSHVTCHVYSVMRQTSCVTCHMSHVKFHVSHVPCNMSIFLFFYFFWQSGEAYRWRFCFQRLVSLHMDLRNGITATGEHIPLKEGRLCDWPQPGLRGCDADFTELPRSLLCLVSLSCPLSLLMLLTQ